MKKNKWLILIGIALISLAMHWRHFNKELISWHVWRQTQTQSTINNFYEEDFNILHPKKNDRGSGDGLFQMEFPLMQWLVAGTYKIWGNHLIISRIFMFITGLFSVLGMYTLLKNIFQKEKLAIIGAWCFNFSPCFFYFTINPIPDNLALCCSIWGLSFFFGWTHHKKYSHLFLSGLMLSIGALCKLPFVIYFIVPFVYLLVNIRENGGFKKDHLKASIAAFITILFPFAWYISVIPKWRGNGITSGVLDNQVSFSTVLDYLQHNLFSTLPESLLNYGSVLFFLVGFYFLFKNKVHRHQYFLVYLLLSLVVLAYFFFEINMIAKVHDYYLFPFYPLLFMLVGYGAYYLLEKSGKWFRYLSILALVSLPVLAHLRMEGRWDSEKPGFNKDWLVYKTELRNAVPKDALCIAGNDKSHFILFYYIDKKGWCFDDGHPDIKQMINEGAKYLYLDTLGVQTDPVIKQYCDQMILQKGSVQVYQLIKP